MALCHAWATGLAALLTLSSAPVRGEGFSVPRFVPTAAGEWSFGVDRPWYSSTRWFAAGLTLDYAHAPLVVRRTAAAGLSDAREVISHQLLGHVDLAGSFLDRVLVSASLPIRFVDAGQVVAGVGPAGAGLSDPNLGAMARLWGHPDGGPLSVHLGARLFIPVTGQGSLGGDRSVRVQPRVVLAGLARRIQWSGSVGFLYRSAEALANQALGTAGASVGSELQLGAAVAYADRDRRFAVGPELLFSTVVIGGQPFGKDFTSLELLLGGHYNVARQVQLGVAVGAGMLREPGTPDARLLVRAAWAPLKETVRKAAPMLDSDGDGIPDGEDRCPGQGFGGRPDPRRPGCPWVDNDNDGVPDAEDLCPNQDAGPRPDPLRRGCPAPDEDADSVPDAVDACPTLIGAPSPDPKRNGCPGLVRVKDGQIVLLQQVFFATNEDRILPESYAVLQAVVDTMVAEPEIRRLSIEGHTDERGESDFNQGLSERRARSVYEWLVSHGVGPERLESHGYGRTRPIDTNATEEGRQRNRRVEFHILKLEARK